MKQAARAWSRGSIPFGFLFGLLLLVLACDDHDEFRKDVALCEEAVAAARTCCPGSTSEIQCHYSYEANTGESSGNCSGGGFCGCNDRERKPDLSESESECLIDATCEQLRRADCKLRAVCI